MARNAYAEAHTSPGSPAHSISFPEVPKRVVTHGTPGPNPDEVFLRNMIVCGDEPYAATRSAVPDRI